MIAARADSQLHLLGKPLLFHRIAQYAHVTDHFGTNPLLRYMALKTGQICLAAATALNMLPNIWCQATLFHQRSFPFNLTSYEVPETGKYSQT